MSSSSNLVPTSPQPLSPASPDSAEFYSRIGTSLEAVKELGSWIARSGVFNCQKDEQGNMIALECLATRKTPFDFKREFHLVNGSLTMRSDAMLAGYRTRGGKVIWKQFDSTAAIGIWKYDGNECEIGFTTEDAKIAGLLPAKPGSGWQKDPAAMLRARCISKAIRMLAPEVVAGLYSPEEAADFSNPAPAPTVTPDPIMIAPAPAPVRKPRTYAKKAAVAAPPAPATPDPKRPRPAKRAPKRALLEVVAA